MSSTEAPMASPRASFRARGAIFLTASRMPAALFLVGTIYVLSRNMSTPGFSTYMPVTVGMPSFSDTAAQTEPQATP